MVLYFWLSSQSQKVGLTSIFNHSSTLIILFPSWLGPQRQSQLLIISPPAIPLITCSHIMTPTTCHDTATHHTMCGQSLMLCNIWAGPIYCRLPRTGSACMYYTRLLCKVSRCQLRASYMLSRHRCTAPHDDLDWRGSLWGHVLTNQLVQILDIRMLWEDYGIVGNVVISHDSYLGLTSTY